MQLRNRRQDPPNSDQHSAGADIERSRKFQKFFPFRVMAAHKNRDGKRQSIPLAPLSPPIYPVHAQFSVWLQMGS